MPYGDIFIFFSGKKVLKKFYPVKIHVLIILLMDYYQRSSVTAFHPLQETEEFRQIFDQKRWCAKPGNVHCRSTDILHKRLQEGFRWTVRTVTGQRPSLQGILLRRKCTTTQRVGCSTLLHGAEDVVFDGDNYVTCRSSSHRIKTRSSQRTSLKICFFRRKRTTIEEMLSASVKPPCICSVGISCWSG